MGFSHNELFQDKEYLEAIHMVMDLKGIVPVVGTVLCKVNTEECTMEEKWYSATSGLLSMLPKFGGLKRLEKKVSIAINSRKENIKVIGALNKARNMELLFGMFYGNAKTGAKVLEKPRNEYLQKMLSDIKNKAKREKRKEYIAKNKGIVHNPGEWIEMRVCTDGKPTKMMEVNEFYKDDHHQDSTSLFGDSISADKIPYIVLPLIEEEDKNKRKKKKEEKKEEEDMSIYKYSVGVIIDKEGNYLYCVAAESGPKANGMGEMSIYAAWRMKKLKIYFDVDSDKPEILDGKYIIAADNKDEGKKYKFILFSKSAHAPEKTRSGWYYKNQKKLYKQIIEEGKKCYRGTGKCLN